MDPFLQAAIEEAKLGLTEGGLPMGSVLVHRGKILGRGRNRRLQRGSIILHAELDALENAGIQSVSIYRECVLYTTVSPCPMCSGAILLYEIPRVIIGENQSFLGEEDFLRSRGVQLEVLQDPTCIGLMREFIAEGPKVWNEDIEKDAAMEIPSRTLGYAKETLRQLRSNMARVLAAEPERPGPTNKDALRERLARMAARALDKILVEKAEVDAGAEAREAIENLFGETFPLLCDRSRKHLLFAERFRRESPDLAVFVGIAYGLILEHELGGPVFLSLRDQLRSAHGGPAPQLPYNTKDYFERLIGSFLNGNGGQLTLGQLVGGFRESVLTAIGPGRPVFDAVRSHVETGFREPERIIGLPDADVKRQSENLDMVVRLRNDSAHPNDAALLTAERLLAARSALAGPDGFLPVFLRARFGRVPDSTEGDPTSGPHADR